MVSSTRSGDRAELNRVRWSLLIALALGSTTVSGGAAQPEVSVPKLEIELRETDPQRAAQIDNLDPGRLRKAAVLTGQISAGEPIHLVLAPESSEVAKTTPRWIAGFAVGNRDLAILFPARSPGYPDSTFEELVLHEVAHILIFRAAKGHEVPRWFNEGLALFVGGPWRLEDRTRVSWALLRRRRTGLGQLDRYFGIDRSAARHAYALSGAFVQDLIRRHGADSPARILAGIAAGLPFEASFERTVGLSLSEAERSFWSRYTFWYRWLPIITSSATLWLFVTALFLLAARARRKRTSQLLESWEDADREPPVLSDRDLPN